MSNRDLTMNPGANHDMAARAYRLRRIAHDIQDGLDQQVTVTLNERNAGIVVAFEHDARRRLHLD